MRWQLDFREYCSMAGVIAWETMRGRNPLDNLEEVDVDDAVEEVDGGVGDWANRPNAGEGKLNCMPLSFLSVCGGKG